jgi:hypothetical protein
MSPVAIKWCRPGKEIFYAPPPPPQRSKTAKILPNIRTELKGTLIINLQQELFLTTTSLNIARIVTK